MASNKSIPRLLDKYESIFSEKLKCEVKIYADNGKGISINIREGFENSMIPFDTKEYMYLRKGQETLYSFVLYPLPTLCGSLVFGYLKSSINTPRADDFCTDLLRFIQDYAYERGYTNILCSNVVLKDQLDYNYPTNSSKIQELKRFHMSWNRYKFKQNLLRTGFEVINEYENARSGNLINIFNINL